MLRTGIQPKDAAETVLVQILASFWDYLDHISDVSVRLISTTEKNVLEMEMLGEILCRVQGLHNKSGHGHVEEFIIIKGSLVANFRYTNFWVA